MTFRTIISPPLPRQGERKEVTMDDQEVIKLLKAILAQLKKITPLVDGIEANTSEISDVRSKLEDIERLIKRK